MLVAQNLQQYRQACVIYTSDWSLANHLCRGYSSSLGHVARLKAHLYLVSPMIIHLGAFPFYLYRLAIRKLEFMDLDYFED